MEVETKPEGIAKAIYDACPDYGILEEIALALMRSPDEATRHVGTTLVQWHDEDVK